MDSELIKEARAIEDTVTIDTSGAPARTLVVDVRAMTVVKVLAVLFSAWLVTQVWPLVTLLALSVMLAAAL
ncbi:MAG TPA: hypothetical protein VK898_00830, partial [Chloroflexota bacterium]|nr:hypothetical protein [Chloroflexota bacterium]